MCPRRFLQANFRALDGEGGKAGKILVVGDGWEDRKLGVKGGDDPATIARDATQVRLSDDLSCTSKHFRHVAQRIVLKVATWLNVVGVSPGPVKVARSESLSGQMVAPSVRYAALEIRTHFQ